MRISGTDSHIRIEDDMYAATHNPLRGWELHIFHHAIFPGFGFDWYPDIDRIEEWQITMLDKLAIANGHSPKRFTDEEREQWFNKL